jgi:hypothetical protein
MEVAWRASIADLYVRIALWYRLDLKRQTNTSKKGMIYFVIASGTKRCKVIGMGWLGFRREETHHHHGNRHHCRGLQLPTMKEIPLWLKGRFLVPPQKPIVKANPPIVSTSILHWSTNVPKRGASSMRISRRAT